MADLPVFPTDPDGPAAARETTGESLKGKESMVQRKKNESSLTEIVGNAHASAFGGLAFHDRAQNAILAGAFSAALLGLVGGLAGCHGTAQAAPAQQEETTVKVETVAAEERTVPRVVKLTGNLEADRSSDVAADASGKVSATFVERGAYVKKGTVLAILDSSSAAISAAQARADADGAAADAKLKDSELARTQKLHAMKAIPDAELDRAKAARDTANDRASSMGAKLALQSKTVGDATIRAPFDGIVTERFVDVGEYVRPDTKIATIVRSDVLRLRLSVPESSASAVKEGQSVDFKVASDGPPSTTATHTAKIRFVGAEVRQQQRDLLVEAMYDNHDHALRPGMFATARLAIGEEKGVVIPQTAVKKDGATRRVFVLKTGRIEERVVQLGEPLVGEEQTIHVVNGLTAGEKIAPKPDAKLRDGLKAE
jgi:membrane fusion protein, multidrug efflux system